MKKFIVAVIVGMCAIGCGSRSAIELTDTISDCLAGAAGSTGDDDGVHIECDLQHPQNIRLWYWQGTTATEWICPGTAGHVDHVCMVGVDTDTPMCHRLVTSYFRVYCDLGGFPHAFTECDFMLYQPKEPEPPNCK